MRIPLTRPLSFLCSHLVHMIHSPSLRRRFCRHTTTKAVLQVSTDRRMDGASDVSFVLCLCVRMVWIIAPHSSLTPHISLFLSPSPYLGMLKGPDKGSFYNERFLRGMPFLSKKMKRIGGVKDVDASINNEPLLQKISDIHPPPEEVPKNTLDYLVLSTINRCIQEEGPKAKMPFVPGPPLAKSSSRKRKAESDSKLPAASVPPSTLAASSNDSLSSLEDHQEESQEESNTAAYPNTLFGQTHHAGDLIQQHQPPPHQPQLNNPLLLPNQAVDQNQLQQMQSQNQSQQMNSLLLQIMMAGTNPAAAALMPNSQNQQALWQNQLLGAGGIPTLPFASSHGHPGAPPSQQDHSSSHAQVAQPHAQVAQAQATQGKTK